MVVSKSTPINRRAAQENAAMQEQTRASNLAANAKAQSAAAVQTMNTLNMTPEANRDADWNTQYKVANDANSLSNTNNQYFNDIATKPVQDNYATPTNDLGLGYNPSNLTVQNNQLTTNNELMGLDGKFNASAIKRLRATGMSDADIKKTINGLKPSIKETMSNTGLPPVTNEYLQKNNVDLPFGGSVVSSQMGANGNPEYILSNGLRVSASAYDQESVKANVQARNNAQISGTVNGAMTTSTTPTTPSIPTPNTGVTTDPNLAALTANVPPEYKPFVDYYLNQAGNTTERTNAARDAAQTAVSGADAIAGKEAEAALVRQTNNEAEKKAQEALIEENRLKQEKFLAEQKQVADDQLALEEAKVLYDDQAAKKQSLFEMTNALALSGGFSSGNGLAHIQSTKSKLDEHTEYLTKSYGIEKRKLINDFKASYLQVEQQADSNMQIALQNYKAEANAINAFSLQSQTNKINSKTKAVQDFSAKVDEILKDRDIAVSKAIEISMTAIKEENKSKRDDFIESVKMQREDMKFAYQVQRDSITDAFEIEKLDRTIENDQLKMLNETRKEANTTTESLRKEFSGRPMVKSYNDFNKQYAKLPILEANRSINPGVADEGLVVLWEKMLDEGSVVREGEFDRVAVQAGLKNQSISALQKAAGAGNLLPAQREAIKTIAEGFNSKLREQVDADISNILSSIKDFNEAAGYNAINYNSVFDKDTLNYIPKNFEDSFLNAAEETNDGQNLWEWKMAPPEMAAKNNQRISTTAINGTVTGRDGSKLWKYGADIAANIGEPVRAHRNGTIVAVINDYENKTRKPLPDGKSQNKGFGNQVQVKYGDGTTAWYSHLDKTEQFNVGEKIPPGTILGYVGNTGSTYSESNGTGAHLDLTLLDEKGKYLSARQALMYIGAFSKDYV